MQFQLDRRVTCLLSASAICPGFRKLSNHFFRKKCITKLSLSEWLTTLVVIIFVTKIQNARQLGKKQPTIV